VPWKETCAMFERVKFIGMYLQQEWTMAELCRFFDISRKTGYKTVKRFQRDGLSGLEDRSRAPHRHPHAVSELIEQAVMAGRQVHPRWGPKKLKAWLQRRDRETEPFRACRRQNYVRDYCHGKTKQVFTGGPGTGRADG